jgi:hypothetical protein
MDNSVVGLEPALRGRPATEAFVLWSYSDSNTLVHFSSPCDPVYAGRVRLEHCAAPIGRYGHGA